MRRALILVFLTIIPSVASAQFLPQTKRISRYEFTLFGGYRYGGKFDFQNVTTGDSLGSSSVDSSGIVGIGIGVPVGADYHIELWANKQSSVLEITDDSSPVISPVLRGGDIDMTTLHLGVVRNFFKSKEFATFVGLSAGLSKIEPQFEGLESDNRISVAISAGCKYIPYDHLGFRLDLRGTIIADKSELEGTQDSVYTIAPMTSFQTDLSVGVILVW
jgi:hypothetical protein